MEIRITPDTNILVSATLTEGHAYQLLTMAAAGRVKFVVSADIMSEVHKVISRKRFCLTDFEIFDSLKTITELSDMVSPAVKIDFIKSDPSDNIILEAAVAGSAEYIVSGDQHLLDLREYDGIKIIRLAEALKILI